MKQSEVVKLQQGLRSRYEVAQRTFVNLQRVEATTADVAKFLNELGVGKNERAPSLSTALVARLHEGDRHLQAEGFSDGVRWLLEELEKLGLLEVTADE